MPRISKVFVALALLISAPAAAQDDAGLAREMRGFADMTAGQRTGGSVPADKVLSFGRRGDSTVVTGMAVAPPDQWPSFGEGTMAVMRTRSAGDGENRLPPSADFGFVQRTGIRLFVVGEWSEPAIMWEIAREGTETRFREIDAEGTPGPWRTPAAPAHAAH